MSKQPVNQNIKLQPRTDEFGLRIKSDVYAQENGFNSNAYQSHIKRREQEMVSDLKDYKEKRRELRLEKVSDEAKFLEQLKELEKQKEHEIKTKFEKERIKQAVHGLEKEKIEILKNEKKIEMERMEMERKHMSVKENELLREIERLEKNNQEIDKIFYEEQQKVNDLGEGIRDKRDRDNQGEKQKMTLFQEKADRVAYLKAKREGLLAEKDRINNLIANPQERAKMGGNLGLNERIGAGHMLDEMRGLANYGKFDQPDNAGMAEFDQGNRPISKRQQSQSVFQNNAQHLISHHQSQASLQISPNQRMDGPIVPQNESVYQQDPEIQRVIQENQRLKMQLNNQQQMQQEVPKYQNQPVRQMHFTQENSLRTVEDDISDRIPSAVSGPNPHQQTHHQQSQQGARSVASVQPMIFSDAKARDFDDFLQQNFLQNQMKNVDLNEDERTLLHLQMQEADSMRMLARLQPGTELYRFKVEQYKELSTQRAEVEKIVQQERLRKLKRGYELATREQDRKFDNQKFIDGQRKKIIDTNVRKQHGLPPKKEFDDDVLSGLKAQAMINNPNAEISDMKNNGYNSTLGFTVHFDYVFGIPDQFEHAQIIFAVCSEHENILEPQLIPPKNTVEETVVSKQCIFYENRELKEIPADRGANLLMEIQLPKSIHEPGEYKSLG